jgi:hypothetical protein
MPPLADKGEKMPRTTAPLSTTGLSMPSDFPVADYDSVHKKVQPHVQTAADIYEQFGGAWNALSYRFLAVAEYEAAFDASLTSVGSSPVPTERYRQERDLFGFFSNGFAVLETAFYGLFSLGALLSPQNFPIATCKDKRKISPTSTAAAITKAFPSDPINLVISAILNDPDYLEWRDIRNILTHRVAPCRKFFEGGDDDPTDQWKIKSIPLNGALASERRADLSRLTSVLLQGIDQFAKSRL